MPWLAETSSAPVLRILFQSDVLHCLAVSSLLLLAAERCLPGLHWQVLAVTTLTVWAVVFSDMMAAAATGFIPLDAYLSKAHGSIFPLFPWFAFAGFGFLAGQQGAMRWWLGLAGVFGAFALPWMNLPATPAFFSSAWAGCLWSWSRSGERRHGSRDARFPCPSGCCSRAAIVGHLRGAPAHDSRGAVVERPDFGQARRPHTAARYRVYDFPRLARCVLAGGLGLGKTIPSRKNGTSIMKCWLDMRPDFAFASEPVCKRSTSSPHLCDSAYD